MSAAAINAAVSLRGVVCATKQHLHRTQVQVSPMCSGDCFAEFTLSEANVLAMTGTVNISLASRYNNGTHSTPKNAEK